MTMHAIPRFTVAAGAAALLLGLLGGCATADPLAQPEPQPVPTPDPNPDPDPDPDPNPDPDPDPLPVETNEVRLTWVETGGASTATVEFPDGLPYFASFEVSLDEADAAVVDSVSLATAGEFAIDNDGCTGATVGPDEPCAISLQFDAGGIGRYQADLAVTTAGGSTASIAVVIDVVDEIEDEVDPDTDDTNGTDTDTDTDTDGTNGTDTDGTDGTNGIDTDGTDGTDPGDTDTGDTEGDPAGSPPIAPDGALPDSLMMLPLLRLAG
jgi:hypothetical protein